MLRVLQLLGTSASFEARRTADLLLHDSGTGFHPTRLSLGRGGNCPNPLALARRLRQASGIDLIHAFGIPAASTAAVAARAPLLCTLEPLSTPQSLRWLASVMTYRRLQVVCGSAAQYQSAGQHGIPVEHCQLIRPGIEFARVRRRRDPALRASLGFTDDDIILLAPGETTRAAAHERAAWVASILHVLNPKYRLLLWGSGPHTRAVATLARRLKQPRLLTMAQFRLRQPIDFESLTTASDLALITAPGLVSHLPIITCMAAGLPTVAVTTPATAELLEDRHTAWMTTSNSPRELARRVLDVRADPTAAWRYADRARSEAFDFFSASRLLSEYRPLLSRIAAGAPAEPSLAQ